MWGFLYVTLHLLAMMVHIDHGVILSFCSRFLRPHVWKAPAAQLCRLHCSMSHAGDRCARWEFRDPRCVLNRTKAEDQERKKECSLLIRPPSFAKESQLLFFFWRPSRKSVIKTLIANGDLATGNFEHCGWYMEKPTSGRQSVLVSPPDYSTVCCHRVWLASGIQTWVKKEALFCQKRSEVIGKFIMVDHWGCAPMAALSPFLPPSPLIL